VHITIPVPVPVPVIHVVRLGPQTGVTTQQPSQPAQSTVEQVPAAAQAAQSTVEQVPAAAQSAKSTTEQLETSQSHTEHVTAGSAKKQHETIEQHLDANVDTVNESVEDDDPTSVGAVDVDDDDDSVEQDDYDKLGTAAGNTHAAAAASSARDHALTLEKASVGLKLSPQMKTASAQLSAAVHDVGQNVRETVVLPVGGSPRLPAYKTGVVHSQHYTDEGITAEPPLLLSEKSSASAATPASLTANAPSISTARTARDTPWDTAKVQMEEGLNTATAKQLAEPEAVQPEADTDAQKQFAVEQKAALRETAKLHAAKQAAVKQEAEKQKAVKQLAEHEAVQPEAVQPEAVQPEAVKQLAAQDEAVKQLAAEKEVVRGVSVRQLVAQQKAAKQKASQQLAAKQEAEKQLTEEEETVNHGAVRQFAATQKAVRQAAAKQRSAKRLEAKQAAAKQEAAKQEETKKAVRYMGSNAAIARTHEFWPVIKKMPPKARKVFLPNKLAIFKVNSDAKRNLDLARHQQLKDSDISSAKAQIVAAKAIGSQVGPADGALPPPVLPNDSEGDETLPGKGIIATRREAIDAYNQPNYHVGIDGKASTGAADSVDGTVDQGIPPSDASGLWLDGQPPTDDLFADNFIFGEGEQENLVDELYDQEAEQEAEEISKIEDEN